MGNNPTLPVMAAFADVFHVDMDGNKATISLGQVRDGVVVYHSAFVLPTATALELASTLQALRAKVAEQMKEAVVLAAKPKKGTAGKRRNH